MKKIFVLTGEPSGDKLAATVIDKLQQNHSDIEYLSVGGFHLNKLCLLYTSPSPRDVHLSRMPSSA